MSGFEVLSQHLFSEQPIFKTAEDYRYAGDYRLIPEDALLVGRIALFSVEFELRCPLLQQSLSDFHHPSVCAAPVERQVS
ncbi:MAG: hypothetical protein OXE94_05470 [Aestuariivita sp.]|nr:hypothetical protein [Aestuariivita sp.]